MKTNWRDFESVLADDIKAYLCHKRALCKCFLTEEYALRALDRFLQEQGVNKRTDVTSALLESFFACSHRIRSRSYNHLLCVVRRLLCWMVSQGIISVSPVLPPLRRATGERVPCILNKEQVSKLLDAAGRLPDSFRDKNRGRTYRMMFALLYALGLRVSEASRLQLRDVDLERQLLVIRESKFAKSRLVPFGPNIARAIIEYIGGKRMQPADQPVFSFDPDKRRPVSRSKLTKMFHQLIGELNIQPKPGESYPRLHDLRHSMAVGTLLRWYREGKNPSDRLMHLSTFLGHSCVSSTSVYLTITSDLLIQAGYRFEQFALPLIGGEDK